MLTFTNIHTLENQYFDTNDSLDALRAFMSANPTAKPITREQANQIRPIVPMSMIFYFVEGV